MQGLAVPFMSMSKLLPELYSLGQTEDRLSQVENYRHILQKSYTTFMTCDKLCDNTLSCCQIQELVLVKIYRERQEVNKKSHRDAILQKPVHYYTTHMPVHIKSSHMEKNIKSGYWQLIAAVSLSEGKARH